MPARTRILIVALASIIVLGVVATVLLVTASPQS